jgi:hypothetical protein
MRKRFVVVAALVMASASAAEERPTLRDREAPRATDLLRAEKLADQARKRLEMPSSQHRARWKHGGAAWGAEVNEPVERSEPVIINVRPPSKRRGG